MLHRETLVTKKVSESHFIRFISVLYDTNRSAIDLDIPKMKINEVLYANRQSTKAAFHNVTRCHSLE
jgi:hypothetical protein